MADLLAAHGPFVDGAFTNGDGADLAVHDPYTEEAFCHVPTASVAQVEQAIAAARAAFDEGTWPGLPVAGRVRFMARFTDALAARRDTVLETAIAEVGYTRAVASGQVELALANARQLIELYARLPEWEHNELSLPAYLTGGNLYLSVRRYEPVGVVAAITPYNVPFITNIWKVVAALLTGCTVVLRPSPFTPLEALVFGEAAVEAGLPPGVLNVVPEPGPEGGRLLSSHPQVDLVSFTGSIPVGRVIAAQGAPTLKRLILELGGKSAQLYLPDAVEDSPEAVVRGAASVFATIAGQGCSLLTRILVPEGARAAVLAALATAVPTLAMGDPRLPGTVVGPLISGAHRDSVARLVEAGIGAGARVVAGGPAAEVPPHGWFYPPTVLDIDDNANPVARREVFGPVVTVQGYQDFDHAVAIANDVEYGLSNGIFTRDLATAERLAARLRSGTVQVNRTAVSGYTPFGGYKQSGIGQERGAPGLRAFQEIKHVVIGAA